MDLAQGKYTCLTFQDEQLHCQKPIHLVRWKNFVYSDKKLQNMFHFPMKHFNPLTEQTRLPIQPVCQINPTPGSTWLLESTH